VVNQVGKR